MVCLKDSTLDHILHSARRSNNDMRSILEGFHVIANVGAANASVSFDVHEIADCNNHFLDLLSQLTGRSKDQSLALRDRGINFLKN